MADSKKAKPSDDDVEMGSMQNPDATTNETGIETAASPSDDDATVVTADAGPKPDAAAEPDSNDPVRRHPSDPEFSGKGIDLSVYGDRTARKN